MVQGWFRMVPGWFRMVPSGSGRGPASPRECPLRGRLTRKAKPCKPPNIGFAMGTSQKGGAKIKIFGPVFLGFRPEIDPGTPLDRPGTPRTSICTKNQPRRPILRPFRKKIHKKQKNPLKAFKRFFFSIFYDFLGFFKPLKVFFSIFKDF